MLQLHLSDRQFYCQLGCALYKRLDGIRFPVQAMLGNHHFRATTWAKLGNVNFETDHDDVIKWKHFPRYWPFMRGIHRWPVNSPHKGQWRGALMFSLICVWTNRWVNKGDAGGLRRHWAHYSATVMILWSLVGGFAIFIHDYEYVTREISWQIIPLATKRILVHDKPYTFLYFWFPCTFQSHSVNTLRPRQNCSHFPDDIFKWIFLNKNVWISLKVSPKSLP